jgi:hypothetical protein
MWNAWEKMYILAGYWLKILKNETFGISCQGWEDYNKIECKENSIAKTHIGLRIMFDNNPLSKKHFHINKFSWIMAECKLGFFSPRHEKF